jgi:hypothetical protein
MSCAKNGSCDFANRRASLWFLLVSKPKPEEKYHGHIQESEKAGEESSEEKRRQAQVRAADLLA